MQCPEASLVAGYKKWQTLGRHVKQGEKAISILCPCVERHKQKVKDKDKKPVLDENGNEVEEEIIFPHFRIGNQNKKKKAKNSYMVNGGEKCDLRLKRIMYYTKRERNRLKKAARTEI